ncbi:MAG: hypothetical protein RLO12_04925 [Fulvivirga sp.]
MSNLTFVIAAICLAAGFYYLGYHHGLEFMRKSDSGLGGLMEIARATGLIFGGFALIIVGLVLKK